MTRVRWTIGVLLLCTVGAHGKWQDKVDPRVLQDGTRGETEFLVILTEQAAIKTPPGLAKKEKGARIFKTLTETSARSQAPLLKHLQSRDLKHQSFWIANMILAHGTLADIKTIAQRPEVLRITGNPTSTLQLLPAAPAATAGIELNITATRAPEVWALGHTGQGVVIGGQDTGYQWNHPTLINQYRGWDGTNANHNYNWHDAIHSGGGVCGPDSPSPCDDHYHGTHTMGTMLGDDGAGNQIGMAPGAKWIGARNMDQGTGSPATYAECFQWFLAPTDLSGLNTNPALAPDVINNSWYCDASEGCTDPLIYQTIVENLRAAGIVVVVSAGNFGTNCSTVTMPAIYDASFTVGATDNAGNIASFSSRGPITVDGSNRIKPDITAPGVSVRSCAPTDSYKTASGTSMAGPHVAGLVALLISAHPELRGNVDMIEYIITRSAVPRATTQTCGGLATNAIPNNTYGWGWIDAVAALGLDDTDGDGTTDYHEFLAGTDHRDPTSRLYITDLTTNLISFTSITDKLYRLEYKEDLSAPTWQTITNVTGTGGILAVPDPTGNSATQRFYRIRLLP